MEQTDIEELIAEELLGNTLTEEERRQLEAWLEADPAHAEWYARIREARFSTFRYETYSHIDSYKAYEHFLKKTRRTSWLKRYARTVAACLIPIFLIGGALWVNHYYKPVSKACHGGRAGRNPCCPGDSRWGVHHARQRHAVPATVHLAGQCFGQHFSPRHKVAA